MTALLLVDLSQHFKIPAHAIRQALVTMFSIPLDSMCI